MKVKSIIYMVLALSLCCGCSDWLTVDSKTILVKRTLPNIPNWQKHSSYPIMRNYVNQFIVSVTEQCRTGNIIWMLLPMMERAILPTRMGS